MSEFIILAIPFVGTSLGSAMVFFLKKRIAPKFEKMLLGFAAGVMIAASVWSLLIPSIDMSKGGSAPEWLAALVGFLAGIFFLLLLDTVIPHMHIESKNQEGIKTNSISKTTMMLFAVTLHNIPEGMSVGVAFAGAMMKDSGITATAAMAAGAMMYVVIEELIPESQTGEHSNIGTIGAAVGFALMMVLDIALG